MHDAGRAGGDRGIAQPQGNEGRPPRQPHAFRPRPCARRGCRSGRARCSTRSPRSRRSASPTARDFYWTLHAVFVNRRRPARCCSTRRSTSSGATPSCSRRCWRSCCRSSTSTMPQDEGAEMLRRLAEALHPDRRGARERRERDSRFDAAMTFSDREQLRTMDFEKMSLAELARAKAAIARLRLPIHDIPTRRYRPRPARRPRRHARDAARRAALGRPHRAEAQEPPPPPAAARRPVRHFRAR